MFTTGKLSFKTKTEALAFFKSHVNGFPINQEFESEYLSDLIAEHHYYCKENNLRPIKFKKIKYGGSYLFTAYFLICGWKQISWKKCIELTTLDSRIKSACRDLIASLMKRYKDSAKFCEKCGSTEKLEVDHKTKNFADMMNELIESLSEDERAQIQKENDWLVVDDFCIKEDSPLGLKVLKAHSDIEYQVLCKSCHTKQTSERVKAKSLNPQNI